jgi:hypothetical protein
MSGRTILKLILVALVVKGWDGLISVRMGFSVVAV